MAGRGSGLLGNMIWIQFIQSRNTSEAVGRKMDEVLVFMKDSNSQAVMARDRMGYWAGKSDHTMFCGQL